MIGIGVIGYGYWGPNLVRNFLQVPDAQVIAVSDVRSERLKMIQRQYPTIKTTTDCHQVIQNPNVDAVVIATPVTSHFELANMALRAGKHVLVEKPLAATSNQCASLIEEAEKRNRVLMVDHT